MMTSCSMRGITHGLMIGLQSYLLLMFCCHVVLAQDDQAWIEKPENQPVALGGTATFVCKTPNLSTNIIWTKGIKVLFSNQVRYTKNAPPRYELVDPYTLRITNVTQSDNDMYGCNIPDFGSASANLTVLLPPGPPTISSDLSGGAYKEGQTVRFTCSSSGGNPPPTITWMKNDMEILNTPSGQTTTEGGTTTNVLTVTMDHSDHQAKYTCYVYNRVNEDNPLTESRFLNVLYSPIITFAPFSPYTVRLGHVANITCHVDANPPANVVTWQKNGQNIPGADFVKLFSPITRNDAGNYTCTASNALNSNRPVSNTIRVDVVYPPVVSIPGEKNVTEYSSLAVSCNVDANPEPYQIVWEKVLPSGQRNRTIHSSQLTFTQIRREDAGNYSCKANSFLKVSGSSSPEAVYGEAFMNIHVLYKPGSASIAPVGNVDVGQPLEITCSASPVGYPAARFRWQKNSTDLPNQDATYYIPSAQLSDTAVYRCTPFNSEGSGASASISISINESPKFLQGLEEKMTKDIITKNLSFTCIAQGRPKPAIEWFKDSLFTSLTTMPQFYTIYSTSRPKNTYSYEVTSVLYFEGADRQNRTKLRVEDMGNYSCRVTSPEHTAAPSSTIELQVHFAPVALNHSLKIAVTVSDRAVLPCEAQSNPRPIFKWYRDGQIVDTAGGKFSERQMEISSIVSGYQSQLTISRVNANDYGLYNCFISNSLANVSSIINVTTKSTPEAPTSLQTLSRTWESIFLQWSKGFDGGYPQKFQIRVQEQSVHGTYIIPGQPLSATEFNVTGLKPSTRYEFSVFGQNELGLGQHSTTITSQTRELEIPSLGSEVPVFHSASKQLIIVSQPPAQYCLKIDAKDSEGKWRMIRQCTRVLGGGSLEILEDGVQAVNVSVCLVDRPEICGLPVQAEISKPDSSPALTVIDVIIIAAVCAVIIITLLIILICFICRRRRTNFKEYENTRGIPPSASNGGIPGKKMQSGPGQSHGYDSADGRYPTFPTSSEHPPNYWELNPHHYDSHNNLSFESQIDRQMNELELNRRNDLAIYDRADVYRHADTVNLQGRPLSPTKDKYIDLEDRKDPSLQSQESGYSTGDPNKPKKVIYEVVV